MSTSENLRRAADEVERLQARVECLESAIREAIALIPRTQAGRSVMHATLVEALFPGMIPPKVTP